MALCIAIQAIPRPAGPFCEDAPSASDHESRSVSFTPTHPALARALAERDYTEATPVQAAVLEPAAAGRDLLVSAQTGSGKTVAYGLAVGDDVLGEAEALAPAGAPLALVVAPTRELAMQVAAELAWLYAHAGARIVACVGGMDPRRERRSLEAGVHIVVGTPGRLRDHIERGGLDLSAVKAVVLDEADEMLDLGFREDLEFILDAAPPARRTLLFSATLPKTIVTLAERYQRDALRIAVAGRESGHADIEYRAVRVAANEIEHAVVNILRQVEAPTSLIFLNTRNAVRHMHATLVERGFAAVVLSGELGQNERNQALQALRDGRARVCVATDVAARGIDLPSLGLVIHVDLPQNPEILQHRSGRTGRAGRKGVSVLLVPPARRRRAEVLLSAARLAPVWSGPPTAEEIRRLDQERFVADAALNEPASEEELVMARALLAERPAEEVAAALVRSYRARLPAPEEVLDPGPGREPRRRDAASRYDPLAAAPPADFGRDHQGTEDGPPRGNFADSVWFRLNVGRRSNADPRWLLPLICRRGGITRRDVGAIRIADGETAFEITAEAAERFAAAIQRTEGGDARIVPFDAPRGADDDRPPTGAVVPADELRDAVPDTPRQHRPASPRHAAAKPHRPEAAEGRSAKPWSPEPQGPETRTSKGRAPGPRPAEAAPHAARPDRGEPPRARTPAAKPAGRTSYQAKWRRERAQDDGGQARDPHTTRGRHHHGEADDRPPGGRPSGPPKGRKPAPGGSKRPGGGHAPPKRRPRG